MSLHAPLKPDYGPDICFTCTDQNWPCDAALLEEQIRVAQLREATGSTKAGEVSMEERLAGALRAILDYKGELLWRDCLEAARAVLKEWDERQATEACSCNAPVPQPCGPTCRYLYADGSCWYCGNQRVMDGKPCPECAVGEQP